VLEVMAFRRFAITGIVGAGSLVMIKEHYEKSRVKASWTTHHNTPEPSRKWDDNWDWLVLSLLLVEFTHLFFRNTIKICKY